MIFLLKCSRSQQLLFRSHLLPHRMQGQLYLLLRSAGQAPHPPTLCTPNDLALERKLALLKTRGVALRSLWFPPDPSDPHTQNREHGLTLPCFCTGFVSVISTADGFQVRLLQGTLLGGFLFQTEEWQLLTFHRVCLPSCPGSGH